MAGRRYSLGQLLVGLVALVAIAACAVTIHRQWQRLDPKRARRGPRTTAERWRVNQSPVADRSDAASVRDWQVSARPVMVPADAPPAIAQTYSWSSYSLDRANKTDWRVPEVRPAVAVSVDVVLTSNDGKVPSLWPGLAALRLLRGDTPEGAFRPVSEVPRARAELGNPEQHKGLESAETLYTHRIIVFDLNPDLTAARVYKVQMLDAAGKVLEESGPCTGWAMATPQARAGKDAAGLLVLSWTAPAVPADRFVGSPCLVAGLSTATHYLTLDPMGSGFCELGRLPLAAGEFTVPLPMGDYNIPSAVAQLAIVGATRRQTWSRSHGPGEDTVLVGLSRVVAGKRDVAATSEACPERERVALMPRAGDRNPYAPDRQGTAFTLQVQFPRSTTLESLLVRYAKRGTTETIKTLQGSIYQQPAGLGERCLFTLTARKGTDAVTATASAYSPPAPKGFRAISAPDAIRLLWDPLDIDAAEWAAAPEFVVRRGTAAEAGAGYGSQVLLPRILDEISRVPAGTTEFTDRSVRAGEEYFYVLDLEGSVRATCTVGSRRDLPITLPVRCGNGPGGSWSPLLVKAEVSGPVRVALGTASLRAAEAGAARAGLEAGLRREAWIQLLERTDAGQLLDERGLAALSEGAAGTNAASPEAPVQAADVVLDCRPLGGPRPSHVEVGLTDVRRQHREAVGSWPAREVPWDKVVAAVVARLQAQFPDWQQRGARAAAPAAAPTRQTLAVLVLEPVIAECDDTLPAGTLEGLLTAAISEDGHWQVVDRERLAAVLAEQGLTAAASGSRSLALGRLLNADAMVTGTYTLKQGRMGLAGRLVSVAGGQYLTTVEVSGNRADLGALARQFAAGVAKVRAGTAVAAGDSATRRAMEVQASTSGRDSLEAAKTAAYVSGSDPDALQRLGREYAQKSQPEEALNCFRQALAMAPQAKTPVNLPRDLAGSLREEMDGLLRQLGRPQERVTLWQGAAEERPGEAPACRTSLRLAEALRDAGNPEPALAALRRSKEPHRDSPAGVLYARLGDVPAAVDTLLRANWFEPGRLVAGDREITALGPGYAAVIRLLEVASPEQRLRLLDGIISHLEAQRPGQTLRAATELRRAGPLPTERLLVVLRAALAADDTETTTALVQEFLTRQPEDIALLRGLSGAAEALGRHGRHDEEATVAKRALGLAVKGEGADVARAVLKRRLDQRRDEAGKPSTPSNPGADEELWRFVAAGGGRTAGRDPDRYVLTETGFVLRVKEAGRQVVWQYDLHFRKPFPKESSSGRQYTLRLVQNGFWITTDSVFACNYLDGVVHALDLATGKPRWTHTEWTTVSPPVVRPQHDVCVCVANGFGELVILGAKDGHLVKRVPAPEPLQDTLAENLSDVRVVPRLAPGNEVLWTDWVRVSLHCGGGFGKRNYWSLRGTDPYEAVLVDTNLGGTYSYHMVSGEVRIDDPALKGVPTAEGWERGIASRSIRESRDHVLLAERSGDPRALPALLKVLRDPDADEDARQNTIDAILRLGGEEGLNAVIDALTDPSYHVRSEANRALYNCEMYGVKITPSALGRLAKVAHGADEDVAGSALGTLVRLGGVGAKPLIQDILDNPASPLRTRAAIALAEVGDTSVLPVLRPLLRDGVPFEKQQRIIEMLSALGDPKARALYLRTIDTAQWLAKVDEATQRGPKHQDIAQARVLVEGITRYAPDETLVPFLEELSKYYGDELVEPVCAALGRIGAPRSVPFLMAMLPEPQPARVYGTYSERAQSAWRALCQISGEDHGMKRDEWQTWWETHRTEVESRAKTTTPKGAAANAAGETPRGPIP